MPRLSLGAEIRPAIHRRGISGNECSTRRAQPAIERFSVCCIARDGNRVDQKAGAFVFLYSR